MTGFDALWLPILLAAVVVFVASSVIHMGPFWHRNDYPRLAQEDAVIAALRPLRLPPGDYVVPRAADMKEMATPQFQEKQNEGPVLVLTVLPNGPWSMGRNLSLWFGYCLVVSIFAAYVAGRAVPAGPHPYLAAFRFAGVTAFVGYSLALWQMSIWYHRAWSASLKATLDGLIYALLSAGIFGWLWPRV